MLFSKKRYTIFIGKDRIDPGLVVLDDEPVFYADEAFAYVPETFAAALASVGQLAKRRKARIVLSDELAYVTEFRLPAGTALSRDLVRQEAESSIPEDLRSTDWDFQALRYASKAGADGSVSVQVAVIQSSFAQLLHEALPVSGLSVESIVPESYALALLEPSPAELSVIIAQNGPAILLAAVRDGFVVASETKHALETGDIEAFIAFSERRSGLSVARLVCSGVGVPPEMGRPCESRTLNPLIGAAYEEKISGNDEAVLNLAVMPASSRGFSRFFPWNLRP